MLQAALEDPRTGQAIEMLPIPLGARGKPTDVAAAVVWLLSRDARYVHGSILVVDGGTDALLFPDRFP